MAKYIGVGEIAATTFLRLPSLYKRDIRYIRIFGVVIAWGIGPVAEQGITDERSDQ